jgi:hypothetical protein
MNGRYLAHEKEGEMSNRDLVAMRDSFSKGDKVLIQRRPYNQREGTVHRGEIIETRSTHAVVFVEGRKSHEVIQYKKLLKAPSEKPITEKPPAPPPLEKAVIAERALRAVPTAFQSISLPPPTAAEPEPPPVAVASEPPPAPAKPERRLKALDDIAAWLEMGASLSDSMKQKVLDLRKEAEDLDAEAERLAHEAEAKNDEADVLEKKIAALEALTRVA